MATLKGEVFGRLSGKIGKVVARRVNGKTVISERPDHYKETTSEEAKNIRSRFSIAVEFSSYICSIALLKAVWNYNRKKHSNAFNMMQSFNIKSVGDNAPSLKNTITPRYIKSGNECVYPLSGINFNGLAITAVFEGMDELISLHGKAAYYLQFVILYYEPKVIENEYFIMDQVEYQLDASESVEKLQINLSTLQRDKAALYNKAIVYSAAVVRERDNEKFYCSITFAKEFALN